MTIQIRPRTVYVLLSHIENKDESHDEMGLKTSIEEDLGYRINEKDFLGHLDYLNQKGFIQADFSGDPYGDRGPNPLPMVVMLKDAKINPSGQALLQKLRTDLETNTSQKSSPISPENMTFLEKVMVRANLPDIFDARDVTEVIFRTMRDVMQQSLINQVEASLHQPASRSEASISEEVADLWADTNPVVQFISRIRGPLNIDAELFQRRIRQEGGLPKYTNVETILKAVFSATKELLSAEQVTNITQSLPGEIQTIWQNA